MIDVKQQIIASTFSWFKWFCWVESTMCYPKFQDNIHLLLVTFEFEKVFLKAIITYFLKKIGNHR